MLQNSRRSVSKLCPADNWNSLRLSLNINYWSHVALDICKEFFCRVMGESFKDLEFCEEACPCSEQWVDDAVSEDTTAINKVIGVLTSIKGIFSEFNVSSLGRTSGKEEFKMFSLATKGPLEELRSIARRVLDLQDLDPKEVK